MADSGVLLVLDNLETLLTADGTWRDPRWGQLVAALTGHDGESRVILTSRTAPAGLGAAVPGGPPPVVTLPVHALSLEEAVALARELPTICAGCCTRTRVRSGRRPPRRRTGSGCGGCCGWCRGIRS